ncbi:MAG: hypothetical protein V4787_01335 [Pseudomonadota bacterium]
MFEMHGANVQRGQDNPALGNDAPSAGPRTVPGDIKTLSTDFGLMGTGEASTAAEVLEKLAHRTPDRQLDVLCDSMKLQPGDRAAFKKRFHEHMAGQHVALTKQEEAALQKLTKLVVDAAMAHPGARGKGAQAINTTVAASLAWAFSFLPLTLTISGAGTRLENPADSLHFFALAGPLILLCGDVMAGSFIQQGAGYVPLDQIAYQSCHTHVSQLNRLELKMAGVRHAGRENTGEYQELERQHKALRLQVQSICIGLIERELGQVLDLKDDANEADVPDMRLLGCIRSHLKGDDKGRVFLPDGTHLFNCTKGDKSGGIQVTWPDGAKPADLSKELIPRQHEKAFAEAEKLLLGAARTRSLFCDEAPGLSFALFYGIHGLTGPTLQAATDNSVVVGAVANLAASFCSLQGAFHGGNAMLSWMSGRKPHAEPSLPERNARFDHADFEVKTMQARVRESDEMRLRLETELSNLHARKAKVRELLDAPDGGGPSAANLKETLGRYDDLIALRKQARLHLKSHARDAVKALAAAESNRGKSSGVLAATWAGARETWKGHTQNLPRLMARVVGFSLPYIVLAEVFLRYASMLAPPAPGSHTPGANETALNQTTAGVPAAGALDPFLSVIWANGLQVAVLFGARNLVVSRGLEFFFDAIAGGGEYVAARLGRGGQGEEDILVGSSESDTDSSDDDSDDVGLDHGEGGRNDTVASIAESSSVSSADDQNGTPALPAHAQLWADKKDDLCTTLSLAQFRAIGEVLQHVRPGMEYSLNSVLKENLRLDPRQRVSRSEELDRAVREIRPHLRNIFGRQQADALRPMLDAMMDTATESLV